MQMIFDLHSSCAFLVFLSLQSGSQYAPSAQGSSSPAARSSSSGYDIGSILGALGSLSGLFSSSGSGSSSTSGSTPYTATTGTSSPNPMGTPQGSSGGSISKVLSNVMSNPATLDAFQRARRSVTFAIPFLNTSIQV
jgi:hypothetical protein